MEPALKSNSGIEPRDNVRPVHRHRGGLGGWETAALANRPNAMKTRLTGTRGTATAEIGQPCVFR